MLKIPKAQLYVPTEHEHQAEHEVREEVPGAPVQDLSLLQKFCTLHGQAAKQEDKHQKIVIILHYMLLVDYE